MHIEVERGAEERNAVSESQELRQLVLEAERYEYCSHCSFNLIYVIEFTCIEEKLELALITENLVKHYTEVPIVYKKSNLYEISDLC